MYRKYETAATLMAAVKRYEYVRQSEYKSVDQYFNQTAIFDRESVEVENIMRFFDEKKRNHKWIVFCSERLVVPVRRMMRRRYRYLPQ